MKPINKNPKTLRFVLAFPEKLYTFAPEKSQFFDVRYLFYYFFRNKSIQSKDLVIPSLSAECFSLSPADIR